MIKFFRKIRYDLMNQNKTTKYFKYAIGEIALVMIGILLALQINNWNENRKDRLEEKALLTQLQSEFNSNLKQLDQKINIRNSMITGSLTLLDYADNPSLRNNDSIIKYLMPTILSPTFDPIVNDLISSGRVQLLTNNRLKELLSLWTSEIVQVTEEEITWNNYKENFYRPYLMEHTTLRNIYNYYWSNNTMDSFHLDKGTVVKFDLKESKNIVDLSKIFDNQDIEDHLAFCATMTKIANTQSRSLRLRIVELLEIIDKQLKNGK